MGDVEEVLSLIKDCWPHFHITKENLLHPTPELVIKFYSCFVSDYNEAVYSLTGVQVPNDDVAMDLEPEERLFLQLSKLIDIQSVKFTLWDIYAPIAVRTKNFFKLCVHLIAFVHNILECERDRIENDVFKTKDETSKLLIEQEELLDEINGNARNKELIERNKALLEQTYKSTKNSYEEMKDLRATKEKLYAEKKQQIEILKGEMQNEQYELNRLEAIEKDLLQQRTSESDYQNILQKVENLKTESEMLDNYALNIGDGLVHENEILQHTTDCLVTLNQFAFNVQNVKNLIDADGELKVISNTLEQLNKKINLLKQQLPNAEKKLLLLQESFVALQNGHRDTKEHYTLSIDQSSHEIVRFKEEMERKSQNHTKTILKYDEDIKKLEEDMEKLKRAFANEYIKVSKVERRVVDNFRDMLMKCNNSQ